MNKQLWKIIYSNARATVKLNDSAPQKMYSYAGITAKDGTIRTRDYQIYLNQCAQFVLMFVGGVWEDHPDQGF